MKIIRVTYSDLGLNNDEVEKIGARVVIKLEENDARLVNMPSDAIEDEQFNKSKTHCIDINCSKDYKELNVDPRIIYPTMDDGDFALGCLSDEEIESIKKWFNECGKEEIEKAEILDRFEIEEFNREYEITDDMGYLDAEINRLVNDFMERYRENYVK